ncbi:MAG: hypothetical protein GX207_00995 [Peptococcaceae bacterium]|nr:hypothetical protein [Peptococcaceae bacterium]
MLGSMERYEANQRLYQERLERLERANRNEQPDRIPVMSATSTWAYYYKGYLPKDGWYNSEITEKVYRAIYEDFYFDAIDIHPIAIYHPEMFTILGGGCFTFNEEGLHQTKSGAINVMEPEEYKDLIKDPYSYLLNTVFPRRYKLFSPEIDVDTKVEGLKKFLNFFDRFRQEMKKHNEICARDYGLPSAVQTLLLTPVDFILDTLRDFQGIIQDIKRRPEMVRDAGLALVDFILDGVKHLTPSYGQVILIPMHLPPFLSPKDFSKVYWPSYKKLIDELVGRGFMVKCAFERKYEHLYDFLRELPKNRIIAVLEDDDIFTFKKKLGDRMAIHGGIPTTMLYYASKQECLDFCQRLLDEVAPGGGYLFGTNMSMITPSDGKAENLKAVNDFIHKYGVYK